MCLKIGLFSTSKQVLKFTRYMFYFFQDNNVSRPILNLNSDRILIFSRLLQGVVFDVLISFITAGLKLNINWYIRSIIVTSVGRHDNNHRTRS